MKLLPLEEVVQRLDRVVESSPCAETELVWIEIVRAGVSTGTRDPVPPHAEATVLVRVREAGRIGVYQTGAGSVGELSSAVRQALGQSRGRAPSSWRCPPAPARERVETGTQRVDREVATMEPEAARQRLERLAREGESARFDWTVGRVVLANSRGLAQQAAATCISLQVKCAGSAGAGTAGAGTAGVGRAAAAARSFEALHPETIFDRARKRHADELHEPPELPPGETAVVLSPEAVISLLELLNYHALSARSFRQSTSVLRDAVGRQIFDPGLTLIDDGTREAGLPFPFDLCGYTKKAVELVRDGKLLTPAVDQELARSLDLPPTPHAVAVGDSRPSHLWARAEGVDEQELLRRADDGLWIGWLDRTECFDATNGRFRTLARGVRRIEKGRLRRGVPDLLWEGALPDVLSRFLAVGDEPVCLPVEDGFRGGISAPAVALPAGTGRLEALAPSSR